MGEFDSYIEKNRFMSHNYIVPVKAGNDSAEVRAVIEEETKSLRGFAHGGLFMGMADCAASMAARCDGRDYVTQNVNLNFISNMKQGMLRATADVVHRGGAITIIRIVIRNEEDKLMAEGTINMFCITRKG